MNPNRQTQSKQYVGPLQAHHITSTRDQSFQAFEQHTSQRVKRAWGTIYSGGRLDPVKAERLYAELTRTHPSPPDGTSLQSKLTAGDPTASSPQFTYDVSINKQFARAREACNREQERATAEITALERFRAAIKDLDVDTKQAPVNTPAQAQQQHAVAYAGPSLSRVLELFTETFCSLDHYSEDYDEHPLVALAEELTPEIAKHIKSGGMVSPHLQTAIIQKTTKAVNERKAFTAEVSAECDRLDEYQTDLERADRQCGIACEDICSLRHPSPADYTKVLPRLERTQSVVTDVVESRQTEILDAHLGTQHGGIELISLTDTTTGDTALDTETTPIEQLQLQPATPLFKTIYRQTNRLEPVLSEAGRIAHRINRIQDAVATFVSLQERTHYPPHRTQYQVRADQN